MPESANPALRLPEGTATVRWGELYGSSPAYFLAEAAATARAPFIVVAGSGREAEQYLAELRFFAGGAFGLWSFPDRETLPYDPFSPHPDIVSERLATLAALPGLKRGVVVTTWRGRAPSRSASWRLLQVSSACFHLHSSSDHAASNWCPRSPSGSSDENT